MPPLPEDTAQTACHADVPRLLRSSMCQLLCTTCLQSLARQSCAGVVIARNARTTNLACVYNFMQAAAVCWEYRWSAYSSNLGGDDGAASESVSNENARVCRMSRHCPRSAQHLFAGSVVLFALWRNQKGTIRTMSGYGHPPPAQQQQYAQQPYASGPLPQQPYLAPPAQDPYQPTPQQHSAAPLKQPYGGPPAGGYNSYAVSEQRRAPLILQILTEDL